MLARDTWAARPIYGCTWRRGIESMGVLRRDAHAVRLFVLVAILALVATACGGETPAASDGASEPAGSAPATSADASGGGGGGELGTYTLGIFEDVTTDNSWNYFDTEGNTVWNGYLLAPNSGAAYTIAYPGLEMQPDLAEGELQPATEEGDGWVG